MSRQAKLIIYGIVIVFSVYLKQTNKPKNVIDNSNAYNTPPKVAETKKPIPPPVPINNDLFEKIDGIYQRPENGFSPYDDFFGRGIYNNSSGNVFEIKNSNSTDAVVLLVNAYSGRKVRNEYVRKGSTFSMTGVPDGTYYLEWASGNSWSPNKKVGNLTGGFQLKSSFTKTRDREDWMAVSGYQKWSVTLYAVVGGDVESKKISATEFGS